jgi:hypothetical protein
LFGKKMRYAVLTAITFSQVNITQLFYTENKNDN